MNEKNMASSEAVNMEAVRLAVIEGQLSHIAQALDSLISKQDAMAQPLQDQALRIARVEAKLDDIKSESSEAWKSAEACHKRVDVIDRKTAYVHGIVAAAGVLIGMMTWALKDQLEMTRQMPVILEQKEAHLKNLDETVKLLKDQFKEHEAKSANP